MIEIDYPDFEWGYKRSVAVRESKRPIKHDENEKHAQLTDL